MPFKHITETAYLIFLGLLICIAGFLAAMLPALPEGLKYWIVCFSVSVLYPIFLMPTFRHNRADYEFRLLHWFPAMMFILWIVLQIIDSYWTWFHILNLGFFAFWSLPIVALGLGSSIMFSLHVIRRRTSRIVFLSIFLILFSVGAVKAEMNDWNGALQAKIFSEDSIALLRPITTRIRSYALLLRYPQGSGSVIVGTSSSSSVQSSRAVPVVKKPVQVSSVSSSVIAQHTPEGLPKSGPEALAILFATLVALYMGTLHVRGRRRA